MNKRLISKISCLTVLTVLLAQEFLVRRSFLLIEYKDVMKPFLKICSFDKIRLVKSALMLVLFLILMQPGFLVSPFLTSAFGDTQSIGKGLLVAPVKLEFGGRVRSGTFKIMNRDPVNVIYRISFAPLIEKDKGKDAKDWVRFSPRRVKLGPGQHQTVRVVARKPADLAPGEYTARLLIQAIPRARRAGDQPSDQIKINLDIVYGVSIPVVIKHNP